MMSLNRMIFAILIFLLISTFNPVIAEEGGNITDTDTEPRLVEAVVFYRGHNVGWENPTNGPKLSDDKGRTWRELAWPDAKGFSIDVSPDGHWIFVGAGNGIFVSNDGGQTWRLTGGHDITEVQDVRMDPKDPSRAWAISAYGFYRTYDAGGTWEKPGEPQPFGFGSSVCLDRTDPDRVFIGTEVGLFVTGDGGETYTKVGPDAIIRSVIQDLRGSDRFWAGTDGGGLWVSNNNGKSWKQVAGPGEIVNCVAQHPEYRERIYCGCDDGVYFSLDSGIYWRKGTGKDFGEDSAFYGIAFDPDDAKRIYAGCRDGFYESRDAGYTWKFVSQRNAVVRDVEYVNLYTGPPKPLSTELEQPFKVKREPREKGYWDYSDPDFKKRAQSAGEQIADSGYRDRVDPMRAIAIIKEARADEEFYDALRETLHNPGTAMFWSLPAITLYLHCRDELPQDIKELLRDSLVVNTIYRGDTENHWVMYHTALLLTAQTWPDAAPAEWYNGMTSEYDYRDAEEWLHEWFRITATMGQGEFDSPVYMRCFVTPMLVLHEFADDSLLRHKAGMMLDLLLADYAADALEGRYCGGHSRLYDRQVRSGDGSQDGDFFYIHFGGIDPPERFHPWSVAAIYGSYRCPEAIRDIAHRRDKSFVHTEVKRVRDLMRYADHPESPAYEYGGIISPPVFRYNYMTPEYCLGSLHGGILQPIQQHTWDATWIGSAPNTVCFTLHPYWSGLELAMFFPEDPHMLTSSVAHQKSGYTDEDKWTSSSPYERVYQLEDTLIVAYNIPEGDFPQHADLYLPKCLNHEERKGWILGHDGDFYIAIRPLVRGKWREHDDYWRYTIPAGQAAFVVETGHREGDVGYENFAGSVLAKQSASFKETENGPEVSYTNRHGRQMAYMWDGDKRLMDEPITPFPTDYLYNGPLIESKWGSGIVKIYGDETTRVLDFTKWIVEEAEDRLS